MGMSTEQVEIQHSYTLQSLLYYFQIIIIDMTDKVQTMHDSFIHFVGNTRDSARREKASDL